MKLSLVQILVVVANIQVRILKTEVEKGFMRTAVGHELVDPKAQINLVEQNNEFLSFLFPFFLRGNFQKKGGERGKGFI